MKNLKGTCFVIQPFNKEPFEKRYTDIYKPAIKQASFKPYRVDEDPSVIIPIETIEAKIEDSDLCFADITTDNPNVWYELGFAFAQSKPVILVCSSERQGGFPFDIRHRHVIRYETESTSDYERAKEEITERIKAVMERYKRNEVISKGENIKENLQNEVLLAPKKTEEEKEIKQIKELRDKLEELTYENEDELHNLVSETELVIRKIFGKESDYWKTWGIFSFFPMQMGGTSEFLKRKEFPARKKRALRLYDTMMKDIQWDS
jgi:nucleoside 2-deoxyribosyltransferase